MILDLNEKEHRFSRFELITWWDQDRLKNSKVVVFGAGALGNEILKNLALIGVGNVLVVDMDIIENSNLSRSILYRADDIGKSKAVVACERIREIYPEINAKAFHGNLVNDLGLGVYLWADVMIGGLDNREARVAINSAAMATNTPWVDGAIEVLNGVARVFKPGEGPCYECTMSKVDWQLLESRKSCAMLTREEMTEGRVPTTPTSSSIIAGIQVQEAVKIIHGMESMSGSGLQLDGLNGDIYPIKYTRNKNCLSHELLPSVKNLGKGSGELTVAELLKIVRNDLGEDALIGLQHDVLTGLSCSKCGHFEERYGPLGKVTEKEALCPKCNILTAPEILTTLGLDESLNDKTLAEVGIAPFDLLVGRLDEDLKSYLLDSDANDILGDLIKGKIE